MMNMNYFENFNKNAMTVPTFRFECVITQLKFIALSLKNDTLKFMVNNSMESIDHRMENLRYYLVSNKIEGNNYDEDAIFLANLVFKRMKEDAITFSKLLNVIDKNSEDYGPLKYFVEFIDSNEKYLLGNDELEEMSENEPETI